MTSFSEVIARRERLGVSQVELCRRADVHETTLFRAKRDEKEPSARVLRKLNEALDDIAKERGLIFVEDAPARRIFDCPDCGKALSPGEIEQLTCEDCGPLTPRETPAAKRVA